MDDRSVAEICPEDLCTPTYRTARYYTLRRYSPFDRYNRTKNAQMKMARACAHSSRATYPRGGCGTLLCCTYTRGEQTRTISESSISAVSSYTSFRITQNRGRARKGPMWYACLPTGCHMTDKHMAQGESTHARSKTHHFTLRLHRIRHVSTAPHPSSTYTLLDFESEHMRGCFAMTQATGVHENRIMFSWPGGGAGTAEGEIVL